MINRIKIGEFYRGFYECLSEVGYLNPFGRRYRESLATLAGLVEAKNPHCEKEIMVTAFERFDKHVREIERVGIWPPPVRYSYYEDKLQAMMRHLYIFRELWRLRDECDAFIVKHAGRREKNLPVPFAGPFACSLGLRGLSKEDANRWVGIFYQMRRAHYFLTQGLIGQSDCIRRLREDLWNCLFTEDARFYDLRLCGHMEDYGVLLCGPGGSGKGMAAEILGRCGYIPYQPERGEFAEHFMGLFLPVNLRRWSPEQVEGELFGREASAGGKGCAGAMGLCRPWGTVFLDEIAALSGPMQARLLHMLEERSYIPAGGGTPRRFVGRLVAATSRDMSELRRQKVFRDDLFYRLSAGYVTVPSLALRIEQDADELRVLVEHFVRRMAEGEDAHSTGSGQAEIAERVMGVIGKRRDYRWPGNVRELEQCIRRVMLTGVCSADEAAVVSGVERIAAGIERGRFTAQELTGEYCRFLMSRHGAYTDVARITGLNWRTVRRFGDTHLDKPGAAVGRNQIRNTNIEIRNKFE